jgi:hypothetical protein
VKLLAFSPCFWGLKLLVEILGGVLLHTGTG